MSRNVNLILAIGALLVMSAMIVFAIIDLWQQGGSLDDLPADEIAKRVGP